MMARKEANMLIAFLVVALLIGALAGYLTRQETVEIKFGPVSVELRGNQVTRSGSPLTSSQVEQIAIIALIGGPIGLGLGFASKSGRIKV
jgi:hypothetical protein